MYGAMGVKKGYLPFMPGKFSIIIYIIIIKLF